jgi:hypothetical protein
LPSGFAGKPLLTLHDYILGFPRPPLGDRFALAWRLTATVLDILSSGWVHKNIWLSGVLIMLSKGSCPTPYLVGWTSARPNTDQLSRILGDDNLALQAGASLQLEVELYRHPERYHTKKAAYSPKHELYSLGVLLLEIALWTTISKQFEGPIAKVQSMKMLPPLNVVEGAMDKLSQDPRVAREMGVEYARIIRRCLKTDFDVHKHDEGRTALLGQFDALVVDQLSCSMSL